MPSAEDALRQWDRTPRSGFPRHPLRRLQRHRDAQPPAQAQGPRRRRDRHRRPGGRAADGARDPDLPRLLLRRPPAHRHAPPQRAARAARPRARRARAHRPVRQRGAAAARAGRARGRQRSCSTPGVQGICVSLLFSYRNPAHEAARQGDPRGGEGDASAAPNGDCPLFISSELYPLAPRLPAAEHHGHRGLRGRAVARHAARRPRPHQGARRRLRAARHGLARRHDLDRRRPARDDARLRPDRRRRRRALAGRPDRPEATCCAPTSAAPRSTSRCSPTGKLRGHLDAGHGEVHAEHAARADRLGRRGLRLATCASTRTRGGPRSAPTRRARRSARRGPRAASRPSRSPTSTSCSAG